MMHGQKNIKFYFSVCILEECNWKTKDFYQIPRSVRLNCQERIWLTHLCDYMHVQLSYTFVLLRVFVGLAAMQATTTFGPFSL